METDNLKKLQKISRYVSAAILLIICLAILGIIIMGILLALCHANAEWMSLIEPHRTLGELTAFYLWAMINASFVAVIMYIMHEMFSEIRESHTPFTETNVSRLKHVAILLLMISFILPMALLVILNVVNIEGDDMMISIEPMMLAMTVLFYCLSLIFAYGTKLQRESDETL